MTRQVSIVLSVSLGWSLLLCVGSASRVVAAEPSVDIPSDRSRPHKALPEAVHEYIAEALQQKLSKEEAFPTITGSPQPEKFVDLCTVGGVLLGFDLYFEVSPFGSPFIKGYRPYYLTKKGKKPGNLRGFATANVTHLEARPGYVVGSVTAVGSLDFHNLSVKYVKFTDKGVDPSDNYDSPCYGGKSNSQAETFGGEGKLIIGLGGQAALLSVPQCGGITVPAMPK